MNRCPHYHILNDYPYEHCKKYHLSDIDCGGYEEHCDFFRKPEVKEIRKECSCGRFLEEWDRGLCSSCKERFIKENSGDVRLKIWERR